MSNTKLYKLENGLGVYWTIAKDPTEAQNKVESYLNNADYGFSEKRKVFQIAVMAEAADDLAFITNKMLVL